MSFLDTVKNLLNSGAAKKLDQNGDGKLDGGDIGGLKDQAMNAADLNKDGSVNQADLDKAKDTLDVNNDGKLDGGDIGDIKQKFGK